MTLPTRHMLFGMTLGAICATALAAIGPGMVVQTFADGVLNPVVAPGFDTSKLVKFEGRDYTIQAEDWVSQEPLSSQTVKKIEGGRVSYVTIATTSTGTYSSDAMFSNNVQYPGLVVSRAEPDDAPRNSFFYWSGGKWSGFNSRAAHSFFRVVTNNVSFSSWRNTSCVSGKGFRVC
ncbi:MAG: hypothetical protein ACOH2L_18550 [Devosia sp.]